jgi:hypothetical protein
MSFQFLERKVEEKCYLRMGKKFSEADILKMHQAMNALLPMSN